MIQLLAIHFKDLLNPEFYIEHGGLWILLFIVFAETGLLAGFFLPGDSLLFVAGIYSDKLGDEILPGGNEFLHLLILMILISIAGILGNFVGFWFGRKSGPFLYHRKDSFFLRKSISTRPMSFMKSMGERLLFSPGFYLSFALLLP
ncbi:MAG: hypothetical protein WKG06_19760 [Segetibacter sp.]